MSEGAVEKYFYPITRYPRAFMQEQVASFTDLIRLSKNEIRRDIREIEKNLIADDTDSDSSVNSEEVLTSSYPVKPRRTQRQTARSETKEKAHYDIDKAKLSITQAEEALSFIRAIKLSKNDLFQAECEREKLENTAQSFERAITEKSNSFTKLKSEQENYIQLLQAMYSKQVIQALAYSRHNAMAYDMLQALQRRRESISHLESESEKLRALLHDKSTDKATVAVDSSAVLTVHCETSGKDVTLFKGQWLKTPVGVGHIISLNPSDNKVTIQLPFGVMYSCLQRVVCWRGVEKVDVNSNVSLVSQWKTEKFVNIPIEKRLGIRNFIGPIEDQEDFTDQDEDTSTEPAEGGSAANAAEETTNGNRSRSNSQNSMLDNAMSIEESETVETKQKIFPLSVPNSLHNNSRGKLRKSLHFDVLKDPINTKLFPLLFSPPEGIPTVVESLQKNKQEYYIDFQPTSLYGHDGGRTGASESHIWLGNVDAMSKSLDKSMVGINKIEQELTDNMRQAQANVVRNIKYMKDIAYIRLSVATKRIRHRTLVGTLTSSSGMQPPVGSFSLPTLPNNDIIDSMLSMKNGGGGSDQPSPVKEDSIAAKKRSRESSTAIGSKRGSRLSAEVADSVELTTKRNNKNGGGANDVSVVSQDNSNGTELSAEQESFVEEVGSAKKKPKRSSRK